MQDEIDEAYKEGWKDGHKRCADEITDVPKISWFDLQSWKIRKKEEKRKPAQVFICPRCYGKGKILGRNIQTDLPQIVDCGNCRGFGFTVEPTT